jgi:AAA domain
MATPAVQIAVKPTGIYSLGSLLSLDVEAPHYAVEGLINEGQTAVFAGYFGVGKTMFAGQLSIATSTGRDFLGRQIHRPRKTVFIDFETGAGAIKERMERQVEAAQLTDEQRQLLGQNWTYVNALDEDCPLFGFRLDDKNIDQIATFLRAYETEVLIIDNLGWFAHCELQDPEQVMKFYRNLRQLKTVCPSLKKGAILLLHHLVKPSSDRANRCNLLTAPREYLSQSRGSQRLLDFAECRLALAEEIVEGQVLHIVNGVNRTGAVDALIMQLGTDTLSFDLHEDTRLRYTQAFEGKARQRAVYEALPEEFSWTEALSLLISGKRITKDTLSNTLRTAQANKFMVRDENGRYRKLFQPQGS